MNRLLKTFKFFLGSAAGFAACMVVTVCPAFGDTQPQSSLEAVERSLKDARDSERELSRKAASAETSVADLRRRSIFIAARIQEHESILLALEDKLFALELRKRKNTASLDARRQQLTAMLAALQRISLHPPVALIALPTEPVDTVRSALLLRRTLPSVVSLGRALRDDLGALADLTREVIAARNNVVKEDAALRLQQTALTEFQAQTRIYASETRRAYAKAQARAVQLGKEARNLRDLVARLATKRTHPGPVARLLPAPQAAKRSRDGPAMAKLPPSDIPVLASDGLPVRGHIDRRFGHRLVNGGNNRGVSIKTRPGSTVIAPRDGFIVFAGPFRGLGQLLIIEYQAKYHLLLAGLGRIDKQVGENVLAGEPVGTMDVTQNAVPALYMELRRNGQPINPLPWLAAGRTEVNG